MSDKDYALFRGMMMQDTDQRASRGATLAAENRHLREENARLRQVLLAHGIPLPSPTVQLSSRSTAVAAHEEKAAIAHQRIALFRNLFRGREDVYARRWEAADGRKGYMPAAIKDWQAIQQSSPTERKKVDQATRKLLPLTDAVIANHLSGKDTIGIYPLLEDETCWLLAVDFDKTTWQEDAFAFRAVCVEMQVPAALERSRSGNGGHIWIFFDSPLQARSARTLGCLLLTRTMERRHHLGLDSYDRLFPNQDTLPKGGFGNLIALPLQNGPCKQGNSVFIDPAGQPYPDQWQFLASVPRMAVTDVEALIADLRRDSDILDIKRSLAEDESEPDPWTLPPSQRVTERPIAGPLPERVQIVRANRLYIKKEGLPSALINRLLRLAAFQNPEFYQAQAMRRSTYATPRIIACGEDLAAYVALPRGCLADVLALCAAHHIAPEVQDERFAGTPIDVAFHGRLRTEQQEAATAMIHDDDGILCAPTAFGKTAIAAWLIAQRQVNTLVLVHRQQLLDQWHARLMAFFDLPAPAIGQIGGGKRERTGWIDVAVIQSLHRHQTVHDLVADYGQVIVDECHHLAAFSFEQVMQQVKARYVVGLTATLTRKDGHHPIIGMQCGPIRFAMSQKTMTEATPFAHQVLPRWTAFQLESEQSEVTIQEVYAALICDTQRNEMILTDVEHALARGRSPLVLTNRTAHVQQLAAQLATITKQVFVLRGGMGKKQRQTVAEALAAVPEHEPRVIVATGSAIGEGFDDARLDTLFLVMPISWKGTLQQYVGRLHRLHENKQVVQVYDYVDSGVRMLARMYERRVRGYTAFGYVIEQADHPC